MLKKRKSQSGLDTIYAIASIFALGIFCLVCVYTYSQFVDTAKSTEVFNQTQQAIDAFEDVEDVQDMWDYVIVAIFIGFALAMVILGYFLDVSTVFFPFYIIILLVGVLLSAVLSYTWIQVSDQAIFTAIKTASFPITNHILTNLPTYFIIIGALGLMVTYAKTRSMRN